jgi:hypothetical protein
MSLQKNTEKKRVVVIELGPTTLLWLMQIPLVCLKITNMISYPWWMVLSPLWGVFALTIIVSLIVGVTWFIKNTFYFTRR